MTTADSQHPRVLIVTDSKHGATHEIGDIVEDVLVESGLQVVHLEPGNVGTVVGYDAVVFGSAVYLGRWLPDLRHLVEENAQALTLVPVWLFESGPLGDPPMRVSVSEDLSALQRQLSARTRVFPGRLDKAKLGRGERILTRLVRAPYGDFRPLDEVRSWATCIATTINQTTRSQFA